MRKTIGFFDYMKQVGKVTLHEQGTLSNSRYDELKGAQKMIKNYIKDTNCKVDIYDANNVPEDKFVYMKRNDCVFVEIKDLLTNKTQSEEFYDKKDTTSVLRDIFKFIEKANGEGESPIEKMKQMTRIKYNLYLRKKAENLSQKISK